jgi:hypothetical protein
MGLNSLFDTLFVVLMRKYTLRKLPIDTQLLQITRQVKRTTLFSRFCLKSASQHFVILELLIIHEMFP